MDRQLLLIGGFQPRTDPQTQLIIALIAACWPYGFADRRSPGHFFPSLMSCMQGQHEPKERRRNISKKLRFLISSLEITILRNHIPIFLIPIFWVPQVFYLWGRGRSMNWQFIFSLLFSLSSPFWSSHEIEWPNLKSEAATGQLMLLVRKRPCITYL